jgi:hypothetical protein
MTPQIRLKDAADCNGEELNTPLGLVQATIVKVGINPSGPPTEIAAGGSWTPRIVSKASGSLLLHDFLSFTSVYSARMRKLGVQTRLKNRLPIPGPMFVGWSQGKEN